MLRLNQNLVNAYKTRVSQISFENKL